MSQNKKSIFFLLWQLDKTKSIQAFCGSISLHQGYELDRIRTDIYFRDKEVLYQLSY